MTDHNDVTDLTVQKLQECIAKVLANTMTIEAAIEECSIYSYRLWLLSGQPDIPAIAKDQHDHIEKIILLKVTQDSQTTKKQPQLSTGKCSLCNASLVYVHKPGDHSPIICRECWGQDLWQIGRRYDNPLAPAQQQVVDHLDPNPHP